MAKRPSDLARNNLAAIQQHENARTGGMGAYRLTSSGGFEFAASDGKRWTVSAKGNVIEHEGGSARKSRSKSGGGFATRMRNAASRIGGAVSRLRGSRSGNSSY